MRLRPQHLLPGSRSHKDGLAYPDPAREVFIQVFDTGLRKRQNQNVPSTSPTAKPLTALSSLAKLCESVCIACSTILLSWFAPMVIGCLQGQAPRMADIKFLDSVCSIRTCFEYFSLHQTKEQTTESTASTASSMGGRPDGAHVMRMLALWKDPGSLD